MQKQSPKYIVVVFCDKMREFREWAKDKQIQPNQNSTIDNHSTIQSGEFEYRGMSSSTQIRSHRVDGIIFTDYLINTNPDKYREMKMLSKPSIYGQ